MLEVGDEEVGERGSLAILRVEGEVLAVFIAASGCDDREVAVVVAGGVAEIGAAQDGGLVEEGVVAFADFVEFAEEAGKETHFLEFNEGQFFDLLFVPPMVAEVVPVFVDSLQGGDIVAACSAKGHQSG